MSERKFHTLNPTTQEPIKTYTYLAPQNIANHLDRLEKGQSHWRQTPLQNRIDCLKKAGAILRKGLEDYAKLMTTEMGKPIQQSRAEVEKCALVCDYYADNADAMLAEKRIVNQRLSGKIVYEPLGTILAIMPWNFPFWQVFRFAAPNLALGNTAILKHADNVAGCADAIASIFEEAGFPEDSFCNLRLHTDDVQTLLADPRISGVTLTGSTKAGKAVASLAGRYLKKGVFELGGSDPYIILKDADIEKAAKLCAESRVLNSGQSCIAAKRFLVDQKIADSFISAFTKALTAYKMGDPMDEECRIGPMARSDLRYQLAHQVDQSLNKGAKAVLGAETPDKRGFYYPVSLLTGVKPGMPAFDEELFGPVAAVTTFTTEEEAFSLAAQSPFGLGGGVFTKDTERGIAIAAKHLAVGSCAVNTYVKSDPEFPFGGIKQSGYGRELGVEAMREFANIKSIAIG